MRTIITVFRKEMVDTLRDRRTLVFMVVIPLLLFPVLFRVMFSVEKSQSDKARNRVLKVACVDNGAAARFVAMLEARDDIELEDGLPLDSLLALVRSDSLDGVFVVAPEFDDEVAELKPGRVDFYYKSTDDRTIVRNRLQETLEEYERELLDDRFERLEMDASIVDAVEMKSHNVASMEERVGKSVGGMLPYMFIIFCFMGAMYPAIDLGAGEKERGTMETLLTAPVNRFHILLGKFGVVVVSGLVSALVSMAGLYIGVKQAPEIPPEFLDLIVKIFGWHTIALLFSLLLPLTIFFAGILLSVSLTARSFKEAQSLISPLNIAVILPAAIGLIPGITMSYGTALIPVLNVSLATKEILAGTIKAPHLILVYASLTLLAVASLYGSAWWFRRESTIFRS
ncbi:MAG: ABC transporter permease subunit [Candidatus Krumholzibacteria bacterium]|nr:ABC transporter permease subunit [Candidatus Krumholzibacteria bacterium]MDH4337041.1 ABC transporter permease subunit [Candidatus Krumholzibacteria bacterium]MDH5268578.1 ABC transporter permease subunit [Candidatus Krumholzibacteria bacterium]